MEKKIFGLNTKEREDVKVISKLSGVPFKMPKKNKKYLTLKETNEIIEDHDDVIENINVSINTLDETLLECFFSCDIAKEFIDDCYSENFNKKTPEERIQLFANITSCCSSAFGEDALSPHALVISDSIDGEHLFFKNQDFYISKELVKQDSSGLSILAGYVYKLREYLVEIIVNGTLALGIEPRELKGLARIYCENKSESILEGSWSNYLTKDHRNYGYQPIIYDSTRVTYGIVFNQVKMLYQKYGIIDQEMGSLLTTIMEIKDVEKESVQKREKIIADNRKNIENYDTDLDNYERYLEVTASDLSKLSDDEFYALFNDSYYMGLNANPDGLLMTRLTNITNELMRRSFKDFDTSNVVLPTYSLEYNSQTRVADLISTTEEEVMRVNVEDSSAILVSVMTDITNIARKHSFVYFNNPQEQQDWNDMMEWCELKQYNFESPKDKKIMKNGLNIILSKVNEFVYSISEKIEHAISVSSFYPHGGSMICANDKESYIDFHEFKNGLSTEEVQRNLMMEIRNDIAKMKSKGGR